MSKQIILKNSILISFFFCGATFSQEIENEVKQLGFIDSNRNYQVSIYALASQPQKFDNKQVYITGYTSYGYGFRIFADRSSCEDSLLVNSIGVNISDDLYNIYAARNKRCELMSVSGKFVQLNEYGEKQYSKLTIGDIDPVINIADY